MHHDIPLLTTASQARQRSTAPSPSLLRSARFRHALSQQRDAIDSSYESGRPLSRCHFCSRKSFALSPTSELALRMHMSPHQENMPKPDNTEKSDTGPGEKAEVPTASSSTKPGVATSQRGASTLEKVRNAVLTGCGIGFFYALFHSLHISSAPIFWWLVLASGIVFIFAILCRRAK